VEVLHEKDAEGGPDSVWMELALQPSQSSD
jgi:hypothetical protein